MPKVIILFFIVCLSLTNVCRCEEGADGNNPGSQNQPKSSMSATNSDQCSNPLSIVYLPMSVDKKCCKQIERNVESVNSTVDTMSKECSAINQSLVLFKHDVYKNMSDIRNLQHTIAEMHTQLDTAHLKETLNNVNSSIDHINNTLYTVDSTCKQAQGDADNVTQRTNTLEQDTATLKDDVANLQANISSSFSEMTKDLEKNSIKNKDSIDALQKEINTVNSTVQTFKEQTDGNVEMKIKSAEEKSNKSMNQMSNQLDKQIKDLTDPMNKTLKELESELNNVSTTCMQSKQNLAGLIDVETKRLTIEIKNISERLHNELVDASKQTKNDIHEHKLESTQSLADAEQTLNTLSNDKIATIESKLDKSLEDWSKDINTLKTEIAQRIKEEVEQLASQTNEVNKVVIRQKKIVDIIYPNTFNKEMFVVAFLLLVVLVGINYMIVYMLVKRTSPAEGAVASERARHLEHSEEPHSPVENSNAILNHIPSSPALERMLCIISFDEDRQRTHKMLLMSAGIKDDAVKCHVIRRHNQIPNLPRCRVYLMCAEFTERHVIIEEQGLGLGDLHRTTYDAVHKLGGRLIILYTRDPGSRRLKDDQSYNNNIYCVTNQSELAVINKEGCFFSIYNTLNEGQKTRLKNKISQYLQ